jgi:hypothetical protein
MLNDDISVSLLHGYFLLVSKAWMGRKSEVPNFGFKGTVSRDFFYESSVPPGP